MWCYIINALTLGDGEKKRLVRFKWSKRMCSFSLIYWLSNGETSSPKSDWLSFQICLFTSVSVSPYSSRSRTCRTCLLLPFTVDRALQIDTTTKPNIHVHVRMHPSKYVHTYIHTWTCACAHAHIHIHAYYFEYKRYIFHIFFLLKTEVS